MDKKLFIILYNFAANNKIIGKAAYIGTKLSYYFFFLVYAAGAVYTIVFDSEKLMRYLLVPFLALFFNMILRKIFKRPRPFEELNTKNTIGHKPSNSFPSNHSVSALSIVFAVMYINRTAGLLLLIPAFFTGVSRVMVGVHYPADVLAGGCIGAAAGFIGFQLF